MLDTRRLICFRVCFVRRCASSIDREETRREKRARDDMTGVWSAARSSVGAIAFDAAAILVASPARTDEPRPDLGECRLESPGTGRRRTTTRSSEGWMMKFSNRRVDDPGDAARRGASPGGGETHLAERGGDAERRRGFQRALNHEHRVCASRATRSVSAADNRIEEKLADVSASTGK